MLPWKNRRSRDTCRPLKRERVRRLAKTRQCAKSKWPAHITAALIYSLLHEEALQRHEQYQYCSEQHACHAHTNKVQTAHFSVHRGFLAMHGCMLLTLIASTRRSISPPRTPTLGALGTIAGAARGCTSSWVSPSWLGDPQVQDLVHMGNEEADQCISVTCQADNRPTRSWKRGGRRQRCPEARASGPAP